MSLLSWRKRQRKGGHNRTSSIPVHPSSDLVHASRTSLPLLAHLDDEPLLAHLDDEPLLAHHLHDALLAHLDLSLLTTNMSLSWLISTSPCSPPT